MLSLLALPLKAVLAFLSPLSFLSFLCSALCFPPKSCRPEGTGQGLSSLRSAQKTLCISSATHEGSWRKFKEAERRLCCSSAGPLHAVYCRVATPCGSPASGEDGKPRKPCPHTRTPSVSSSTYRLGLQPQAKISASSGQEVMT